jgi:hypothetical protein
MLVAHEAGAAARLFPAPGARVASAGGQNQESACRLLNFVDRRFTFAQRVFGWNLDPETRLGRVLLLRRQAFEAERAGAHRTADFLWVEAHRALKHAAGEAAVWRHALDISAFSPAITPGILRERFIQELFIDLHRAMFDSLLAGSSSPRPADRLFEHCVHAERLADLAGFDAAKAATILRPMFDAWLSACRDSGQWSRAMRICTRLAERFAPDSTYLDELVVCVLRQTTDRLTRPPGSFTARDARYLQTGIRLVERVHDRYGPTTLVLAAQARLHSMHAVALANTGDCSGALVAIAIALDYGGDDGQFGRTLHELTAAMESMQTKASAVRARDDRSVSAREALLPAGAEKGFEPMKDYRRSQRAARIRETRLAADAIDLWRSIRLPRPAADWPAHAHALMSALATVIRNPPASAASVPAAWSAAIDGRELLRDVSREIVEAFLCRRLFGVSSQPRPAGLKATAAF